MCRRVDLVRAKSKARSRSKSGGSKARAKVEGRRRARDEIGTHAGELGGNRSCYCQTNAYKLYTKHRNYERRYAETGSSVKYGGAGEIDNIQISA